MSSLIKSNVAAVKGVVRLFADKAHFNGIGTSDLVAARDPRDEELERLQDLVETLQADAADHREGLSFARAEGELAGREAASNEFNETREKQLDQLQISYESACVTFSDFLARSEALAVLLAKEALEKIVGPSEKRDQLVVDAIRQQLLQLSDHAHLIVEVARLDFPDTLEVERLAESIGLDNTRIIVLDRYNSGDCYIKLRLGTIDLGIDRQWGEINSLFAEQTKIEIQRP
jgi:flagellar biosynthesis/type III secretory pathway protein FliH